METKIFRKIIEEEITKIQSPLKGDEAFEKNKTPENKSSFAFLYWFISRYYPNIPVAKMKEFIVEGTDDGSCDIIFENTDRRGDINYYVIQSKWFNGKKVSKSNSTSELVKSCISDFSLIIEGKKSKSGINQKFNSKYEELLAHIQNNGKVKFIFLALCEKTKNANDNIKKFNIDYGDLINLELYDINKLKNDYIELEYKQVKTHNPIETPYEPIENIDLSIDVTNSIKVSSPDESYIFLVKPKLIFQLFDKYQFSIFYRNIRNPLFNSNFNSAISETLINNPNRFWYYNNGITAITDKIYPFNQKSGKKITVKGIQIINGAQTVYSVYKSYEELVGERRDFIDDRVLITLRIITSSDRMEDMKITKYTNSQNPVTPRDFHSNDSVQKRLQLDFFKNTNIWYETRRGEFRKRPPKKLGVRVVTNELLAQTYLSYKLREPILAKSSRKNLFLTKSESNNGLYETLFNDKINYEEMAISYKLYNIIERKRKEVYKKVKEIESSKETNEYTKSDKKILDYKFLQYTSFNILAAYDALLSEIYLSNPFNLNSKILSNLEKNEEDVLINCYDFIVEEILKIVKEKMKSSKFNLLHFFKSNKDSVKEVEDKIKTNISILDKNRLQFKKR